MTVSLCSSAFAPPICWPARISEAFLGELQLFSEPTSSALTFLRIFMSISFMLDVEELYEGKKVAQLSQRTNVAHVQVYEFSLLSVLCFGCLFISVSTRIVDASRCVAPSF